MILLYSLFLIHLSPIFKDISMTWRSSKDLNFLEHIGARYISFSLLDYEYLKDNFDRIIEKVLDVIANRERLEKTDDRQIL